jgi:hypothetical protein
VGKSSPSPPPAPDPVATAAAQTASNVETAKTQAALNRTDQYTPQGSITWAQDPNNPLHYTSTQQYSPSQQQLYNLTNKAQNLYGNTALEQLQRASGVLSSPVSIDPSTYQSQARSQMAGMDNAAAAANQPTNTNFNNVRDQYISSQMGLIQPQLNQQQQVLESKLANQGVAQGSPAYQNAMRDFTNQQSSMYANILANAQTGVGQAIQQQGALQMQPIQAATGYGNLAGNVSNLTGQAIQQQAALRSQPINEASALLTGQQIQNPQFAGVPQVNMQGTDVLGAYGQQQQALQSIYGNQMQNYASALGGTGALVGTVAGAGIIAI